MISGFSRILRQNGSGIFGFVVGVSALMLLTIVTTRAEEPTASSAPAESTELSSVAAESDPLSAAPAPNESPAAAESTSAHKETAVAPEQPQHFDHPEQRRDQGSGRSYRRGGGGDRGGDPGSSPREPKKIRFNIQFQPWKDIIEWIADQAGLSLSIDTYPQGTFNYRDENYYTIDEAIDVINGFLLRKEFLLIRKNNMLIVHDLGPGGSNGIPFDLVETVFPEDLEKHGTYEVVKAQFELKRTTPDVVQTEIERMLGPQGSVAIMPKSQTILITETVGNLRAIKKVIDRLDNPAESGALRFVELKNITGNEALAIMRNLMGISQEDPSLRAVADLSDKKIWLGGRTDQIEKAIEIIQKIDESYSTAVKNYGELQFDVYSIDTADPQTFLTVCQTLLAGKPGIRLSIDPNTNSLIALAYLDDHKTIRATLEQMQTNSYRNEVIRLGKLTTAAAASAIEKFFGSATSSTSTTTTTGGTAKPPIVETDALNKQIFVRGTASQITQIKALLKSMGETDDTSSVSTQQRETVRNINLSPSAAALIIDQIQQVWPQGHGNEIKVVNPSAIVPTMRESGAGSSVVPNPEERSTAPTEPSLDRQIDQLFRPGPGRGPDRGQERGPEREPGRGSEHPRGNPRNPETPNRSTGIERPAVYQPTVFFEEEVENDNAAATEQPQLRPEDLAYLQGADTKKGAPIVLSIGPSGLMLASEDTEALDALESLIETMSNEAILTKPVMKPYYLQYASASTVSSTLQTLLGSSSSGLKPNIDETSGGMVFSVVGSLGSVQSTGPVTITVDARLNVIYVQANPVDHYTIEKKLLPLLDIARGPEEVKKDATPRLIQLKNMRAEEALELVKTTFADKMQGQQAGTTANRQGQAQGGQARAAAGGFGGQPGGMMGGMPGGMPGGISPDMIQGFLQRMQGGQGGAAQRDEQPKMTLGVHTASNSLIVSAPEVLFEDVKQFVETMDAVAAQQDMITEIVDVKHINPQSLRQALTSVAGSNVVTSSGTVAQPRGATSTLTTGATLGASGTTGGTGFGGSGRGGAGGGGFGIGGLLGGLFGGNRGGMQGGGTMGGMPGGFGGGAGAGGTGFRPGGFGGTTGTGGMGAGARPGGFGGGNR